MTLPQQQFLELLRSGLWSKPANAELFRGEVDWKSIIRIAVEQTVQVIVADGIETLPKEIWPAKEVMLKLMMVRIKTEQMHKLLNGTLNQVVTALNENNIPSVLLKGQGVAQNYPKPASRMCGDIDLYTGVENYAQACEIIENLNHQKHHHGVESDHHMHLSLNGVEIEIHRHADLMPDKRHNLSMQQWTKESIDAHFGTDALKKWDNNGTNIQLATPTFNAFFILHHAVRHMTTEGVGFRQICDWVMYIHKNHQHIDTNELKQKLIEFHMENIWKEFGIMAIAILGLPAEELPLIPTSMESNKTSKLLNHIFISGNFGRFDAANRGKSYLQLPYLQKKWRAFRFQITRSFKLFSLFPDYITKRTVGWICGGIHRVLTGK